MVVVTGPRIDPASVPARADGLEVHGYVPDLHRQLAACDLAVVHGGLSTTMELTAAGGRSCTCRCATTSSRRCTSGTGWSGTGPAAGWTGPRPSRTALAAAIAAEIGREVRLPARRRPGGAARAAAFLAELL